MSKTIQAVPARAPARATTAVTESIFDLEKARTQIDVNQGLAEVVDLCIDALVKTGQVFDRGGILVAIDRDNSIHQLTAPTIRFALSRLVKTVKTSLHKNQIVTEPVPVPGYVGDTIAGLTKWRGMPIVEAITDHPVLTSENRLIGAGYDHETRVFGRFDDSRFSVPENPTTDDALAALDRLRQLLRTFEFETPGDQAAALAAMLTAVSRPVLPTALLTLIDAPMPGSGKGYLGGLIARLAQNKTHPAKRMGDNGDEIHKEIVSALLAAKPVVFFDEMGMSEIDCPAIRMLATAEIYSARLLGVMREVDVSTKTLVLCTGNNVSPTADTARRMLHLRLNPQVENPSARHFKYSADEDMQENRDRFIEDVLTIQRAFLLAHARGETVRPEQAVGGFKAWDLMCRQPILWLGGVDPCERMLRTMRENPAKNELLTIMTAWFEKFGNIPTKTGEALQCADFIKICEEHMRRKPGSQISAISLGLWLKRHRGQVVQGRLFEVEVTDKDGVSFWRVREIGEAS